MKKVLAFAAMALMAFSAQAAYTKWTTGAGDSLYSGEPIRPGVAGGPVVDSAAFVINFTIDEMPAASTAHTLLTLGQWSGGNTHLNFYGSGDQNSPNTMVANITQGGQWPRLGEITKGATHTVIFNYTKTAAGNTLLEIYFDGVEKKSWTISGMNGLQVSVFDGDFYTVNGTAAYGFALTDDHIAWISENGVELPEPTALALLALGVAGVALRRKVK